MDVEEEIGGVDKRTQGAGARQLGRLPRSVERRGRPQPVEVLVDKARCGGSASVEASIGGDIVEGQGQLALLRSQPAAKQTVERDRPADLVAVGQRRNEDVRSGRPAVKGGDVLHAGIASSV